MNLDLSFALTILGLVLGVIGAWPQLRQMLLSFRQSRQQKKLSALRARVARIRRLSQDTPYAVSSVGVFLAGLLTSVLFLTGLGEPSVATPAATGLLMLRPIIYYVGGYFAGGLIAIHRNISKSSELLLRLEQRIEQLEATNG